MESTLEPTTVEHEVASKKPTLVTLVLRANGMSPQRLRIRGGVITFMHRMGVGHLREYTDLAQFHAEEPMIRQASSMARILITTIIGEPDAMAAARGGIRMLIAEKRTHGPTKRRKLNELWLMCVGEIARMEELTRPNEEPASEPSAPPLSPREKEMVDRRSFLNRSTEFSVRGIFEEHNLDGPKLNNLQGMKEAILTREFPDLYTAEYLYPEVLEKEPSPAFDAPPMFMKEEPMLETLPIAELKSRAKSLGFESASRNKLVEFLKGQK